MGLICNDLNLFFTDTLQDLPCHRDTKAYIISVFAKFRNSTSDLSRENITLNYAKASFNHDFLMFQNIGDWLFYLNSLYPEALKNASKNYYYDIGRMSYFNCYRIIRSWQVYERLADEFIPLSEEVRHTIIKLAK